MNQHKEDQVPCSKVSYFQTLSSTICAFIYFDPICIQVNNTLTFEVSRNLCPDLLMYLRSAP